MSKVTSTDIKDQKVFRKVSEFDPCLKWSKEDDVIAKLHSRQGYIKKLDDFKKIFESFVLGENISAIAKTHKNSASRLKRLYNFIYTNTLYLKPKNFCFEKRYSVKRVEFMLDYSLTLSIKKTKTSFGIENTECGTCISNEKNIDVYKDLVSKEFSCVVKRKTKNCAIIEAENTQNRIKKYMNFSGNPAEGYFKKRKFCSYQFNKPDPLKYIVTNNVYLSKDEKKSSIDLSVNSRNKKMSFKKTMEPKTKIKSITKEVYRLKERYKPLIVEIKLFNFRIIEKKRMLRREREKKRLEDLEKDNNHSLSPIYTRGMKDETERSIRSQRKIKSKAQLMSARIFYGSKGEEKVLTKKSLKNYVNKLNKFKELDQEVFLKNGEFYILD